MSKTAAEFTFALLMATAWRLPEAGEFPRDGKWTQNQSTAFLGTRLFGKTLGIVGMGTVGSHVAKRAAACEMRIIYNDLARKTPAKSSCWVMPNTGRSRISSWRRTSSLSIPPSRLPLGGWSARNSYR